MKKVLYGTLIWNGLTNVEHTNVHNVEIVAHNVA